MKRPGVTMIIFTDEISKLPLSECGKDKKKAPRKAGYNDMRLCAVRLLGNIAKEGKHP